MTATMTQDHAEKLRLMQNAMKDPEVLEALRVEFKIRNRALSILAEQNGEMDPEVLRVIADTIDLEEMIKKAEELVM